MADENLPNNPFELGTGTTTVDPNTAGGGVKGNVQDNTNPPTADNPFTMSQSEQATLNAGGDQAAPQQQQNNPQQNNAPAEQSNQSGVQPTPDIKGGTTMQNQGGFGPNQNANPGFGGGGNQNPGFGGGNQGGNQGGGGFGGGNQAGGFNPGGNQGGGNFGGGNQAGGFNPGGNQGGGGFGGGNQGGGNFGGGNQGGGNFGGGNQGGGQQNKYIIVDFFWWINKKIIRQEQLQQGEASILTVGYNASFNNLRFSFHGADQSTFSPSSITMQNAPKLTICNIYAEQALELIANKGNGKSVYSFERVIKAGNWTPNQTQLTWNADNIIIQTTDNQGAVYQFTCTEEQVFGLEKAFDYLTNGSAWNISLQAAMNR